MCHYLSTYICYLINMISIYTISIYIISLFNTLRDPRGCEAPQMTKCFCIHIYDLTYVISTYILSLSHTHMDPRGCEVPQMTNCLCILSHIYYRYVYHLSLSHTGIHAAARRRRRPDIYVYYLILIISLCIISIYIISLTHT